jgi:hypothetical protein
LLAGVVRTYAPCGETPILKVFQRATGALPVFSQPWGSMR